MAERKTKAAPEPWRNRIVRHDLVDPRTLKPHSLNWRKHPAFQQDALRGVLREVGLVQDVIVTENGTILDGHLRVELALQDEQGEIPVKYVDLTEDEERMVLVTLDPMAALAETDAPRLRELLESVNSGEAAVQQMLSNLADISGIIPNLEPDEIEDVEPEIDRAEELREKWGVEAGQLWALGEHRVICGDCTDKAVVKRLMQEAQVSLVVTDPPYGVSYSDKNAFLNTIDKGNRIQKQIKNDHRTRGDMQALWKASFTEMANIMLPGAVVYCFMPQGGDQMMMMMMMEGAGIEPRHEIIWLKNNHVLGRVDYAYKHEPILYAWKHGGHKFYGDFQTSILEYPKPQKSDMHPTTKPVGLIARLVQNSSLPGENIYDPFVGSGTTLIACEDLGRHCYACEIDPGYTAVTLERWHQLTSRTPELIA